MGTLLCSVKAYLSAVHLKFLEVQAALIHTGNVGAAVEAARLWDAAGAGC
jgi:hypothetical protein